MKSVKQVITGHIKISKTGHITGQIKISKTGHIRISSLLTLTFFTTKNNMQSGLNLTYMNIYSSIMD